MVKLPSFQFYPGDWMKDPNLRRCSKKAKGVLMDLLCLMFESEERGVLVTAGSAWSDSDISAALGGDNSENLAGLSELIEKGVVGRNSSGAIFSRRMVRDEEIRKIRSDAGKQGGRPSDEEKQNESKRKAKRKQNVTPSSSSSSSASTSKLKEPPISPKADEAVDIPEDLLPLETSIRQWLQYKREKRQAYKPTGLGALWGRLREIDLKERAAAIAYSMAQNYSGVFQEKKGGFNGGSQKIVGTAAPSETELEKYNGQD